jgi:pseudouridine-5'-phosphate glycosidase
VSNQVDDDGGIRIKGDVRDALENGFPVVALESTIISHGTLFSFIARSQHSDTKVLN